MKIPRILISNDDGIHAQGLTALARELSSVGEVWVVAPDREQSATSHAISLHKPLRIRSHAPRQFAVDGTPTDCVYLALHHLLQEPPDVVVSGINHGPNLGNDVIYSGTVSAAMEGALYGYSAIAVSLSHDFGDGGQPLGEVGGLRHFDTAARVARELVVDVLQRPMPAGVVLNVNVPSRPWQGLQGFKLCRLGYTDWSSSVAAREDPRGRPYYWIWGGDRHGHDKMLDSDNNAIAAGFVALTPIHYDLTDYRSFAYARGLAVAGLNKVPDSLGDQPLPHPVHPYAASGR